MNMKNTKWAFLFILTISIQACYHCEFVGYDYNPIDDSYVKLDNDSYSFKEEDISTTDITEKDSLIYIDYSISRKGSITGSNINIGYGFIIKLEIKKLSNNQFILESGSIEFIKDNVWGDFYYFESHDLNMIEYAKSDRQKEVGISVFTPEKLKLDIKGVISNGTVRKTFDFDIRFETKKVEVKAC